MLCEFSSLKSVRKQTDTSFTLGKHGRLDHVMGTRNVTRSLVEKYTFYLGFNNMGHSRKFKQMRLCADFNAGPSLCPTCLLLSRRHLCIVF